MRRMNVKIALPCWFANLRGPPRDYVKSPKLVDDPCDCASRSTAAYTTVCLSWYSLLSFTFFNTLIDHNSISKNFDTLTTIQQPLKSSLADFTHEQPLSSDQSQALKLHNQGSWASLLLFCLTETAFFSFSSRDG